MSVNKFLSKDLLLVDPYPKTQPLFVLHFIILFYFFIFLFFSVQYDLTIVASDSLNEVEAKVVVFIRDVNDLPPEFSVRSYEATIFEESIHLEKPILQVCFIFIFFITFFFFTCLNMISKYLCDICCELHLGGIELKFWTHFFFHTYLKVS